MPFFIYNPVFFWTVTLIGTWVFGFSAAYMSHNNSNFSLQMLCIFVGLLLPAVIAISMIYSSQNEAFINDFWARLRLLRITSYSLLELVIVLFVVTMVATVISVFYFGRSYEQFMVADGLNIFKQHGLVSAILLLVVPFLEELAWRGYGMDSIASRFALPSATVIFAILWGLWHLPLFFIKGYFHYDLWQSHPMYALNFFVSMVPASFLMNWVYYTNGRSIWAAVCAHFFLNFFAVLFRTELFTKCIITILLLIFSLCIQVF